MSTENANLNAELIALHGSKKTARLSVLHESAARLLDGRQAQRFHLTHAWVYALVAGDEARIKFLETRLKNLGAL